MWTKEDELMFEKLLQKKEQHSREEATENAIQHLQLVIDGFRSGAIVAMDIELDSIDTDNTITITYKNKRNL